MLYTDERDPGNEMPEFGDHVDKTMFEQILEMDEDEKERDFSKPLIYNFFEQAADTFERMERELEQKNLSELSRLGHFLKGSSATLGFIKIRDSCEVIQEQGKLAGSESDLAACLDKIRDALAQARNDTDELRNLMIKYFEN
ncbi:hypothetical protein VTJ83DRAFT_6797 [Remersonia thermophila]|uniref:HPt domain-containing protein n=1 Tax=Remersonia thermophila TaxID=72144 RepID=A0ABR4D7Y9_9PEZI